MDYVGSMRFLVIGVKMATEIIFPESGSPEEWRAVMKNNPTLKRQGRLAHFILHTNETWLPNVLVQAGFFQSGNQVKLNQPKLWRDLIHGENVRLSWANILICHHLLDKP